MPCYAYMVECADGTLYIGWTTDLQKRLETHNAGKGAKYTRTRLPVKLRYYEEFPDKRQAQSREWHLKQLTRQEKLALVCNIASDIKPKNLLPGQGAASPLWGLGQSPKANEVKQKTEGNIMAEKRVMLTEDGYNKLVEKLNYLKSVRRIEIADRLKAAIALGDLSENSEYDDAKNEQAFLEGEIADLEAKIRNSDIIKSEGGNVVQMGSTVVLRDIEFKEDDTYMVVGSTEADPDAGKISNESPVGAAIMGKKVGSIVEVHAPAGIIKYKITKIK